jgi:hypothetical protein
LLSAELRDHVLSCAVCTEARSAAQVMLQTASALRIEDEVPAAGLVWSRAQARKREMNLKRATRPLMVMRILSVAYVILSATWFLHYLWRSVFMELLAGWNVLGNETTCFAAALAVLAIAIAAGYLLHDSRRSGEGVPST